MKVLTQTRPPRLARMAGAGRQGAKLIIKFYFFLGDLCGFA
jgi:hypothetical protein